MRRAGGRTPFAVMRYNGHPPATATIYLPFQVQDEKAISKAIGRILKELHLSQRLLWQRRPARRRGRPLANAVLARTGVMAG
jgi:hypothetical protein